MTGSRVYLMELLGHSKEHFVCIQLHMSQNNALNQHLTLPSFCISIAQYVLPGNQEGILFFLREGEERYGIAY